MATRVSIRKNDYHDSMLLMQINHRIAAMEGVVRAAILMGTDLNKRLLEKFGFTGPQIHESGPSDMVIGLETVDERTLEDANALIVHLLQERRVHKRRGQGRRFPILESAIEARPDANLALISVPGAFAAREARKALAKGLNVFLFSDNVSIEDEAKLKEVGKEKGLLVMGPDCGTAIIDGVGIGFANKVRQGPVGIIGASGTGIQEVSVILDRLAGVGVSQAIGLGGRDLSETVQGASAMQAFDRLAQDPLTEVVVFLSKPASEKVTRNILQRSAECSKPVILCFLGHGVDSGRFSHSPNAIQVESLEKAALEAIRTLGKKPAGGFLSREEMDALAGKEAGRLRSEQRFIRGIYSGGSLCHEAMTYLRDILHPIYSNTPSSQVQRLPDSYKSIEHTFIDMGEDEFTRGRVHPMIDPTPVAERIDVEASEAEVAVILFDVVLGFGAHPDPAAVFVPVLRRAIERARSSGRHISFVCHICGTDHDPQNGNRQKERLQEAGAHSMVTNMEAARLAAAILKEKQNL